MDGNHEQRLIKPEKKYQKNNKKYIGGKNIMKKKYLQKALIAILILMFVIPASSPAQTLSHQSNTHEESNLSVRYTIQFSLNDLTFETLLGYDIVRLRDAGSLHEEGKPMVPSKCIQLAIPEGMKVTDVRILHTDQEELPGFYNLYPAQRPVPTGNSTEGMSFITLDQETYGSSQPYPEKPVTILSQSDLYGQNLVMLQVHPMQFIPDEKKLTLFTTISFEVLGTPGYVNGDYLPADLSIEERQHLERTIQDLVVNPEDVTLQTAPPPPVPLALPQGGPYKHVIISGSTDAPYWEPLVEWHTKRGLRDIVITTDYIYSNYAGASNQQKIRNFVIDAYTSWGTLYFLLAGEHSDVPFEYRTYVDDSIPSDQYYSDFDDDWAYEVYVGRVTAQGASQISLFIDKILKYEKDPPLTNYVLDTTLLGMDLTVPPDPVTQGELLKQFIDEYIIPSRFTVTTVYDSQSTNHRTAFLNALNAGQHLVNHNDHANQDVMATGYLNHDWYISSSNVDGLTNTNQMSIVFSGGCDTTYMDYNDCIAEHFVIYNPLRAGVAFIGNTRYGWGYVGDPYSLSSELDMYWWLGLLENDNDNDKYILGETLAYAKSLCEHSDEYYCYVIWTLNLLGEPAMPIWTKNPETLTVEHPDTISLPSAPFTVHVTSAENPVNQAFVCLWKDEEIFATGYTDAQGDITLQPTPSTGGTMSVTVTKHNYIPYEGEALVSTENPPYQPRNPDPPHRATQIDLEANLAWDGGDPDPGSTVNYDVYFGTTYPPSFIERIGPYPGTQTRITYELEPLDYGTRYYWKIISWDEDDTSTEGPIWYFTTFFQQMVWVDDDFDETTPGWGMDHFATIQDGIDAVEESGTVYVYNGVYYENIVVNKGINLIGENPEATIIDGNDGINAILFSSDHIYMKNFMIRNSNDKGLWLYHAENNTIENMLIQSNAFIGISLTNAPFNNFYNTTIANNDYGLWAEQSDHLTIRNNYFLTNTRSGIRFGDTHQSIITNNLFEGNYEGIRIADFQANGNHIYHNNFISNSAVDYGTNSWDDGYPNGGNYWSDYTGVDYYHGPNQDLPGSDGKGDIPYIIPGDSNSDHYPFMQEDGWTLSHPPYLPSNPSPADGAINVAIDADLSWIGGDPDAGDSVTYDIYFGTITPPPKIISNQSTTTYNLEILMYATNYYWKIVAWDNNQLSTEGSIWMFTTKPNTPPYIPSNPTPLDGALDVPLNQTLSWIGGDPDIHDTVTYDVYFGFTSPPEKVSSNQTQTTYQPGTLADGVTFYWQIVSWDNNQASSLGPIWHFTTIDIDTNPPEYRYLGEDNIVVPQGTPVLLYAQGRDDIALDWAWLSTNETGVWQNFTEYEGWIDTNWEYRKKIVIDHTKIMENFTNFPVFIMCSSPDFIAHVQPDGDDFLFISADNTTVCNHEIEFYNSTNGNLIAWVNVPFISSTEDTVLYLYYGNSVCGNQQNVVGTWGSRFKAVWHMNENPTGVIHDSTANNNDASSAGSMTASDLVNGKTGKAIDFDGVDDYVAAPNSVSLQPSAVTVIAWYLPRSNCTGMWDIGKMCTDKWGNYDAASYGFNYQNNNYTGCFERDDNTYTNPRVHVTNALNNWAFIAATHNATTANIYANAVPGSPPINGVQSLRYNGASNLYVAASHVGSGSVINRWTSCVVDEVWVVNCSLNNSYIATLFNNQNNPAFFYSIGEEQQPTDVRKYGSPLKMQENAEWQWSNYTWRNPDIPADTLVGWKIYYNDTNGNTIGTDVMNFFVEAEVNMPPYVPSNPSPQDGATNAILDSILSWSGGDPNFYDSVTYDVYFGTTSPPPKVTSNQTSTTYDPPILTYTTQYYWKIVAWDNYGLSSSGPIWSFTTEEPPNNPPYVPSNSIPSNGATDVLIDSDLSWTGGDPDTGDIVTYDVYFGTTTPPPLVADGQTEATYNLPTLIYSTTYYWKIVSKDNHGATTPGPIWSFTTEEAPNNPPYIPSNPNPSNGAIGVSIDSDLSWTGGDPDAGDTVTYDVFFGAISLPPKVISNQTGTIYILPTLAYNTSYYWKIITWDPHSVSTEGPLWVFTTQENTPPYIPSNPIPEDGAINISLTADLGWTGGDPDIHDTVTYDVYFGTTSPPPIVSSNQTDTIYDPGVLADGVLFYWQIVAWDNNGASTLGSLWRFTTIDIDTNPPEYRSLGENKTIVPQGTRVLLYAQGRDDIALDWAFLATNETGEWQNFTVAENWFDRNWRYRKEMVIDHTKVAANLSSFPVLVSNTSLDFAAHAQPDGDDFVFASFDGLTKYPHEIEYYNGTSGQLIAWVNVTRLSCVDDTVLYLYYGNTTCDDQQNKAGTWDTNYVYVLHMNDSTPFTVKDSTIHGYTGTKAAINEPLEINGKIGKAQSFDSGNDNVDMGAKLIPKGAKTISCWIKANSGTDLRGIVDQTDFSTSKYGTILYIAPDHSLHFRVTRGLSGQPIFDCYKLGTWDNNQYYYIVGSWDGTTNDYSAKLYINGSFADDATATQTETVTPSYNDCVGNRAHTEDLGLNGLIDEFRVSKIQRNSSWIGTEYNTMNSPFTFITVGSEEYQSTIYDSPLKMQENNQWQWSNFTWQNSAILNGTVVGWRIYYLDTSGNVNCTDIMSFIIGKQPEIDSDQSFVTLTNENMPHLVTCPAGDGPIYQHAKVTCKDVNGNLLPGIPADAFIFVLGNIDATWYNTLSCTFIPVDPVTDANGEIRFEMKGDTSIVGNITIQATVQGVPLNDIDILTCKSPDYFTDGAVILGDFVVFGQDYGRIRWRSDFTGDGGLVGLGDFVMFAQHYGHHS
jgi:parallel beta-helix repeat protein